MHDLIGTYETQNGAKYLQQLCKHFAHKIKVDVGEAEGTCHFPMGPAFLNATETGLTIRFELIDAASIEGAKHVIDKHLERFAFREDFKGLSWDS